MSTAPRFDDGLYDQQAPTPQARSGWRNCLIGCLIVAAGMGVLVVLLIVWVAFNARRWTADLSAKVARQAIEQSDLPPQEKIEIQAQVDRMTDAFREGQMSLGQVGTLFEKLSQSPLMTSLVVSFAETKYFDKSGLTEEEKVAGRQTLQRFVRGTIDDQIPREAVDSVIRHIGTVGPDGEFELKETVADDELRAFLVAAKEEADKAGVPEQPAPIDPSDEIKKIVDEALALPPAR